MLDTRNKVLLSVLLCVALVSVSAFVEELDDSFMETRGADDIWLIKFYAPWCTFCKQLDPVWHQIGSELKSLGSPVSVGKSDATTSTGLAKEFRFNRQYAQCQRETPRYYVSTQQPPASTSAPPHRLPSGPPPQQLVLTSAQVNWETVTR
ncbi:protein disulfide-isomerase TMX3-like protein [Lates japonicus]|uniref:protein disulfide-isomerase n=1 Tax=Lates japonicus TaxID=270547 RepID=A0AAD3RK07_LATJO|nr:protein disulfide-isomerase TMX3-like protein [Lates japonicus]